ncbi:MAG: MATE family efflux transporter [Clostridia bacterium]|nr:MATE family efflux transporter [Clostridia bacterium]NCC43182.1 MATE family efflux transporter [Clostridia bacterium]
MIVPLFFEQLLLMLVGIADTLIVSYAGEAAVSGVSLVNMFNTIFIFLFTALASGGAVIISQYIGNKNNEQAGESSSQLLMFSVVFSVVISIAVLCLNRWLLRLLFGSVDPEVMDACETYLRISAYSYPMLAIYNAGAALYRSVGKTSVTMYISIVSNIINVVGNLVGVFVMHAGVAGVAYPSLIARTFSAAAITIFCFSKKNEVVYRWKWILRWNGQLLKKILNIAVPNGIESGIFQLVKVALSSIVALFGTYQIAANGVAQSVWSLAALSGTALGPVFITVIGQCMGSRDVEAAEYYFKKLLKITLIFSAVWNVAVFALTPLFMRAYALSDETKELVILLVLIHNIFNAVAFPFSGALGNGLRAAGDVKFTMIISILSTVVVRFVLSYLFAVVFNLGVIGIALAMVCDWIARAVIFVVRLHGGKWKEFKVI